MSRTVPYDAVGALRFGRQSDSTSPTLPAWAYNRELAETLENWSQLGSEASSNFGLNAQKMSVGPCIPLAFLSVGIVWGFYAVYPWGALIFMQECPETGMANYPMWLTILFWLVVMALMAIEIYIMRIAIVAQLRGRVDPVTLLGVRIGPNVWIGLNITYSLVGHADLVTNSLFLAKVQKTFQCQEAGDATYTLEYLWSIIMSKSVFGQIPIVGTMQFHHIVLISWLLMFTQVVYALGMSIPLGIVLPDGSRHPDYDKNDVRLKYQFGYRAGGQVVIFDGTDASEYAVPFAKVQTHGNALQALADAGRMSTITSLQQGFYQAVASTDRNYPFAADVHGELKRAVVKFFAFRLGEAVIAPNIQATTLGLERGIEQLNTNTSSLDTQMVFSIFLSLLTSVLGMAMDASTIWMLYRLVQTRGANELNKSADYISKYPNVKVGSTWRYRSSDTATPVFAAAHSWEVIDYLPDSRVVELAPGSLEIVDGYPMAPIQPTGHIQLHVFEMVKANPDGETLRVVTGSTKDTRKEMQNARITFSIFLLFLVFAGLLVMYASLKLFAISFQCRYGAWNLAGCVNLGVELLHHPSES